MTPKMIDLFCGAGLLGHSFSNAGFTSVLALDLDRDAIETYNRNATDPCGVLASATDVFDVQADIIVAGPPCQGFSSLGKRDKQDERNQLSLSVIDWVKISNASVLLVENVPLFLKSTYFQLLTSAMGKLGFECTTWNLNASDYGAAQNRQRAFCVYSKIGLPIAPSKSVEKIAVSDAFANLTDNSGDPMHFAPPISDLALSRIQSIPPNGGKMDLLRERPDLCPASWIKLGNQANDVWGRIDPTKPSNTIRCSFQNPSKGRYIHPEYDRVITLREGARLQGVPDKWIFSGARTSIARQIGNGVPIPLGKAVASQIARQF